MSQLLRTEDEWNGLGFNVVPGELSFHLDRHKSPLWRPDQVELPFEEDITETEDMLGLDDIE